MLLDALVTIGDEIVQEEFPNEYVSITDVDSLSGNQEIHSVVVLDFVGDETGLMYKGARTVDPTSPSEMAVRYGYVNRYNQYDHSLTQRASSSLEEEVERLLEWPTNERIGSYVDEPLIEALGEIFDSAGDDIREDVAEYDDAVEYKALLTISIEIDGEVQYPGEIESLARATFESYSEALHTDSQSASESRGHGRCAVCDQVGEVYGLGANLDQMYTSKKQWPFPQYNASRAWESRPLCAECILSIEVATDRFLNPQSFGAPGIRCRVIPYAIPVEGGEQRLRTLIRDSLPELLDADSDQPLSAAWNVYRKNTEMFGTEESILRLAFVHYVRDSAKAHGAGWIDGVSKGQIDQIREAYHSLYSDDIIFDSGFIGVPSSPSPPTEKQLFTGVWLFSLLSSASDSDHEGSRIGDENHWLDLTQSILTGTTVRYEPLISHLTTEAIARYHDRLTGAPVSYNANITEEQAKRYPYDAFHTQQAYALVRVLVELGLLEDSRTTLQMKPSAISGEFTTLGGGLKEFIDAHTSIAESPGRQAAFVLGAAAAQLSNWQQRRGLNRTFLQNRSVEQLTTEQLTRWQRDIWEKAKVYNAQNSNHGIPWSDAEQLFHDAVLEGRETGWNASTDDLQYHFILGVNVGPRISWHARQNYEAEHGEALPEQDLAATPEE